MTPASRYTGFELAVDRDALETTHTHRGTSAATHPSPSMKPILLLAIVAGCGGHDFDGTWTRSIERDEVATDVKTSHDEVWQIHEAAGSLDRTRGAEQCTLALERGTCSRGCFDQVILAGQSCTLDGVSLVLLEGYMSTTATKQADV